MEASCKQSSNTMAQPKQEEEDEEINICVKIIKTLSLQISKFETVLGLKALLCNKEGIPERLQELFVNGNHLKDYHLTLIDYGICSNTTVSAYVGNSEVLTLTIKIPCRNIDLVVEVKPQATVQNIKALIEDSKNLGSDEFSLVCSGRVLEEEKTLAFFGITSGSTLYVVLNPRDVLQVSVKMLSGETVKIKARALYTILDVRSLVESKVGYSVGVLSYGGKKLKDSNSVLHYNIKDESILEVLPPTTKCCNDNELSMLKRRRAL
ncbi:PREDICTED: polyubiquitin-B-like [Ipomoea nil]|uniref:polyubiquitin-B-like n=1 Tax=Ipomoea nil TaxID=35883 RepID=UPI000901B20F|nr:PREDICTED: polyubiquitin-B-like [Ipomoea nil]